MLTPAPAPIVPIVLAAGHSQRMGYPKALLRLGSKTFLDVILGNLTSAGLDRAIVVLGRDAAWIRRECDLAQATTLTNEDPDRGQISSLQLALAGISPNAGACLVWPVDQPLIPAHLVRDLSRLFRESNADLAMPVCDGRRGHPVIFRRSLFAELAALAGQMGAREVVLRYLDHALFLPTSDRAVIEDIDTPEDYFRLTGR